ncbi:TetR/AcrR family transcriptional regulator [Croceibacterium sp. TMG7-5b_MA50]|uniref:TetR/AcrR family transcriptional regulator n=1 Tax=Croceibacterium sp. TMG7-5b_MA50 TaxID=3121290 RepID=UPI0032217802
MEKLATRGRPREFDTDEALAAALRVFWSKGYDAASLTDLTEAMGITRPSLYAAFGNKEALFKQALDLYEAEKMAYVHAALEAPTARAVAERLLRGNIANITSDCPGCLGVIATMTCNGDGAGIRDHIQCRAESSRQAIVARMQRGIDEGDFTVPIEAEAITRYLSAVFQGIAMQASQGVPREDLEKVADATLALWPGR